MRIVLSCFYLLIFYFEKFSAWIWSLPFAVCRIREASTLIISSSTDSRRPSILQVTSTLTLALYWDLLGLRQAFLPLKSQAKERLCRRLRTRRFTNLIWLFSVNLGSAFFFQDGLLSQGNQDLILKIFSKIPKMSPDCKRLQVISSTLLINSSSSINYSSCSDIPEQSLQREEAIYEHALWLKYVWTSLKSFWFHFDVTFPNHGNCKPWRQHQSRGPIRPASIGKIGTFFQQYAYIEGN